MLDKNRFGGSDQAAGLRHLVRNSPVRVIAVTSGKGGVGKTNISINLAVALAQSGKQTLLLDADLGLANVDVLLGLHSDYNLSHVLTGECSLADTIIEGPAAVKIIPAASGIKMMANLGNQEHAGLIGAFSELSHSLDVMIIDTAAGISDAVLSFSRAAQEIIVVVCDEPASITDAYALMKVLSMDHGVSRFRVVANMCDSPEEGRVLHGKLARVTDRFLDITLDYMGAVPNDNYLRRAVQQQKSVVDKYPSSKSAIAFKKLAGVADKWPVANAPSGDLQFFFERLVKQQSTVNVGR